MVRGSSAAKRQKSSERFKAFRNIAIILVVLSIFGFFYIRTVISHPLLDSETLCPPQPENLTVLLVDVTDPMNLPQRQDFLNQLELLTEQIPRFGKLVITKVDPVSDRLLKPIFERCNPGSAADVTDFDGNPPQLEKLRADKFLAPLRTTFDEILEASSSDRSPILESVQSVALTELQRPGIGDIPKRLIIASDLLQNTEAISFYAGLPEPGEFTSSPAFGRVRTDLRGIQVEFWMLQRDDASSTQPIALAELWEQIVAQQRGQWLRLYRVSG